jgi:LCP family protein required for cell wall assembly
MSALVDAGPPRPPRRRHPVRRFLIAMTACIMVPVLVLAGVALYLQHRLTSQIDRIDDVFVSLPSRPAEAEGEAMNILLLGTDRRSEEQTTGTDATATSWVPGAQRSDAIMILHIDGDRQGASVISIPRDSWVVVPGFGANKINAAFSFGGPSLAVRTIERLTDVRIDHLAVVDWDGFKELTDDLGGVTLDVPETVHDGYRDITWQAGRHRMTGDQALDYVGQRAGLPGGDFDRIHRQQYFLRTLLDETLHQEFRKEPTRVYDLLDTITENLSVDSEWSVGDMRGLLISLRNLRSANIQYLTVPLKGTGMAGAQSVVYLDSWGSADLWGAVRHDEVAGWLAENPDSGIPEAVS